MKTKLILFSNKHFIFFKYCTNKVASSLNNSFFRKVPHVTLLLIWTHQKDDKLFKINIILTLMRRSLLYKYGNSHTRVAHMMNTTSKLVKASLISFSKWGFHINPSPTTIKLSRSFKPTIHILFLLFACSRKSNSKLTSSRFLVFFSCFF